MTSYPTTIYQVTDDSDNDSDSDTYEKVNWVKEGAVTPVKDQGQCSSCWSFSTTGSLEGAHFIAAGELLSFSEQQLIDCSDLTYGNYGCNGGRQVNAYVYYQMSHTAILDSDYPYMSMNGQKGTCIYNQLPKTTVTVSGYSSVTANDVDQMKKALTLQPVAVSVQADNDVYKTYANGVLDSSACGDTPDHAVLAVGYGVEDGQEYWLVKDSYGTNWGDEGYIKIAI